MQRSTVAAVFLLCFAVLAYEVALTRIFAVVLQYHFAFLAVSLAICGLGLGGLVVHVRVPKDGAVRAATSGTADAAMWGINGVMSVVGSLAAAIGATLSGFRAVLMGGASVYILVAVLALFLDAKRRGSSIRSPIY